MLALAGDDGACPKNDSVRRRVVQTDACNSDLIWSQVAALRNGTLTSKLGSFPSGHPGRFVLGTRSHPYLTLHKLTVPRATPTALP
jgi:hypothetical protein